MWVSILKKNNNSIDSNIEAKIGNFQFDRQVAKNFDSHVRKSVPFYEEVQRMIVEISDWFIFKNSVVYDLGCASGETIKNLWNKHHKAKNPMFIGIDSSTEMLEIASHKLHGQVVLRKVDLNNKVKVQDASLCLLLYTLQFVSPANRQQLLSTIYNGLVDNGALILVEKVVGNNPKFNEVWIELYEDMKLRNNLQLEQIKAKSKSLRGVLLNYSQDKNIRLLEQAGFKDIDIFWKWYNFVGIIAVK